MPQTRHDRTGVRRVMEGLWPMVAEPGPNFRWGVVLRKSKLKRTVNQYGKVELVAESIDHQELGDWCLLEMSLSGDSTDI